MRAQRLENVAAWMDPLIGAVFTWDAQERQPPPPFNGRHITSKRLAGFLDKELDVSSIGEELQLCGGAQWALG